MIEDYLGCLHNIQHPPCQPRGRSRSTVGNVQLGGYRGPLQHGCTPTPSETPRHANCTWTLGH